MIIVGLDEFMTPPSSPPTEDELDEVSLSQPVPAGDVSDSIIRRLTSSRRQIEKVKGLVAMHVTSHILYSHVTLCVVM